MDLLQVSFICSQTCLSQLCLELHSVILSSCTEVWLTNKNYIHLGCTMWFFSSRCKKWWYLCVYVCVYVWGHMHTLTHVLSSFSHVWLFATSCTSPPGSSVHGILQARILEWVAISSSRGSSQPGDGTHVSYVSCIDRQVLYHYCRLGSPSSEYTLSNDGLHALIRTSITSHIYLAACVVYT